MWLLPLFAFSVGHRSPFPYLVQLLSGQLGFFISKRDTEKEIIFGTEEMGIACEKNDSNNSRLKYHSDRCRGFLLGLLVVGSRYGNI